jgi:hypothetical protein
MACARMLDFFVWMMISLANRKSTAPAFDAAAFHPR